MLWGVGGVSLWPLAAAVLCPPDDVVEVDGGEVLVPVGVVAAEVVLAVVGCALGPRRSSSEPKKATNSMAVLFGSVVTTSATNSTGAELTLGPLSQAAVPR